MRAAHVVTAAALVAAMAACGRSDDSRAAQKEQTPSSRPSVANDPASTKTDASDAPAFDARGSTSVGASTAAGQGRQFLAELSMPVPERERLQEMFERDPSAFRFEANVTSLSAERARAAAEFKGAVMVFNDLTELDVAAARELAKWPGEALFITAIRELDEKTAIELSKWKGKHLHLDGLTALTAEAATALSKWKGTTLGLGKAKIEPAGMKALSSFEGFVSISL